MSPDLEQEFQLLMRDVIKQINAKRDRGELTQLDNAICVMELAGSPKSQCLS